MRQYCVYIMTNPTFTVLYTGVTNNVERRVFQHKQQVPGGFTKKYNVNSLVYLKAGDDVESALRREKQIKGWTRAKKVALIESVNPHWRDLSDRWYDPSLPDSSSA